MKNKMVLSICVAMVLGSCSSEQKVHSTEELQMSQNVVPTYVEKQMVGAYGDYREVTEEESQLFYDTYNDELKLKPIKVATQVVAGMNYSFICECVDNAEEHFKVVIYKPIGATKNPSVTSVEPFFEF